MRIQRNACVVIRADFLFKIFFHAQFFVVCFIRLISGVFNIRCVKSAKQLRKLAASGRQIVLNLEVRVMNPAVAQIFVFQGFCYLFFYSPAILKKLFHCFFVVCEMQLWLYSFVLIEKKILNSRNFCRNFVQQFVVRKAMKKARYI